jgi:hypothetical protein
MAAVRRCSFTKLDRTVWLSPTSWTSSSCILWVAICFMSEVKAETRGMPFAIPRTPHGDSQEPSIQKAGAGLSLTSLITPSFATHPSPSQVSKVTFKFLYCLLGIVRIVVAGIYLLRVTRIRITTRSISIQNNSQSLQISDQQQYLWKWYSCGTPIP